jgi:hypothetical protein
MGWDKGTFNGALTANENADVKGSDLSGSVFVDPLPLVPIAIGLVGNLVDAELRDSVDNKMSYAGHSFSGELMLSSPVGFAGLVPYLKVGKIISGSYVLKQEVKKSVTIGGTSAAVGSEAVYRISPQGGSFTVGLRYSLLPTISILGEARIQQEQLRTTKIEFAGTDIAESLPEQKQKSMKLLLGVGVGI